MAVPEIVFGVPARPGQQGVEVEQLTAPAFLPERVAGIAEPSRGANRRPA